MKVLALWPFFDVDPDKGQVIEMDEKDAVRALNAGQVMPVVEKRSEKAVTKKAETRTAAKKAAPNTK